MNEIIKNFRHEYPEISLSDTIVSNIIIVNSTVIFEFNNIGFWIKDRENDLYHRTQKSKLTLYECDLENIDVFMLIEKKVFGKKRKIKEYLEFDYLINNINEKILSFEIVQEYVSDMGSLFVGCFRGEKIKADCYLQIDYKKAGFEYEI